ncbi:MAG: hypothetical protein M5R42_11305 [Rhodocyclaceae bacterium]|nr:hypothetical protein [Rhodocyclaceae bacterium]
MHLVDNQRVGSISRSLVWRQVVIIVSTVCVFAVGFHFLLVRPALSELIEKHFQTSSDAARDKLWRVFGYVEDALRVNRERMRAGGFDFGDYRQFNTRFAPCSGRTRGSRRRFTPTTKAVKSCCSNAATTPGPIA